MIEWPSAPTCLVTGGGGFIGSSLVEALVRKGGQVRAFLHYGSSGGRGGLAGLDPSVLGQIHVVTGDVRDLETVTEAMRGVDVVFHLAALVGIPYSYQSPRDVVETNVLGTLNVLSAARTLGTARVIHTSTSEVYGSAQSVPISEAHPLVGQSPYAASKIGADQIAVSFHRSFGVPVSIVRPFNTYGPRQTARAVIPTVIAQALAGTAVKLGSLTPTRDFNFVTDTANAFIAVAEQPATIGGVFNAGSGVEVSIAELVNQVGEIVGRPLEVLQDPQRVRPEGSEVDRLVSDSSRLRQATGWAPQVSVADGLRRTTDWIATNLDRFQPADYGV